MTSNHLMSPVCVGGGGQKVVLWGPARGKHMVKGRGASTQLVTGRVVGVMGCVHHRSRDDEDVVSISGSMSWPLHQGLV